MSGNWRHPPGVLRPEPHPGGPSALACMVRRQRHTELSPKPLEGATSGRACPEGSEQPLREGSGTAGNNEGQQLFRTLQRSWHTPGSRLETNEAPSVRSKQHASPSLNKLIKRINSPFIPRGIPFVEHLLGAVQKQCNSGQMPFCTGITPGLKLNCTRTWEISWGLQLAAMNTLSVCLYLCLCVCDI